MDEHVTHHLLHAIHQGWRNPGDLTAIALAHLFEHCPVCREEFEAWRRQVGEGVARPEGGGFDAALDRICGAEGSEHDELASEAARVEAERRKARSRVEALLDLPVEDRLEWIRSESRSHAGSLLAEALIEECRRKTPIEPWVGLSLANLARTVLQHAPSTVYAAELYALALAHLGNATRVTGDLPRSDAILADARYFLRAQGGGDRSVRAEIDSLLGSLRIGQRREKDAVPLLLRARMVYALDGDASGSFKVLAKLSKAHWRLGDVRLSLDLIEEAETSAGEALDARSRSLIAGTRLVGLLALGDLEASGEYLYRVQELDRLHDDTLTKVRHRWSEVHFLEAAGHLEAAVARMLPIRTHFRRIDLGYDAALCDMDLARLCIRLDRLPEAEHLADEAFPVFTRIGVPVKAAEARRLRDEARAGHRR